MPHYEVTVTASKTVCVKADNEEDANDLARDEFMGDWNDVETEIEDEFDESDPKEAEFIKEYKEQGEFLTARSKA